MTLPEMRNITKCRESLFLSLAILDTHLAKVSLRKVSIESISYIIGLYSCCSQIHLKSTWLKLSVIFSFSLISSKPANGLRSFLPNASLCLTLDNLFRNDFLYIAMVFLLFHLKNIRPNLMLSLNVAFLVTTVSSAIRTSPFS